MKKKLTNHALKIAGSMPEMMRICNGDLFTVDGRYLVSDGYRILETSEPVEGTTECLDKRCAIRMISYLDEPLSSEKNYVSYDVPSVTELKNGIRELCGRKQQTVAWSDGHLVLNA